MHKGNDSCVAKELFQCSSFLPIEARTSFWLGRRSFPMKERGLSRQNIVEVRKLIRGIDDRTGSLLFEVAERRNMCWLRIVPAWIGEWCCRQRSPECHKGSTFNRIGQDTLDVRRKLLKRGLGGQIRIFL